MHCFDLSVNGVGIDIFVLLWATPDSTVFVFLSLSLAQSSSMEDRAKWIIAKYRWYGFVDEVALRTDTELYQVRLRQTDRHRQTNLSGPLHTLYCMPQILQ